MQFSLIFALTAVLLSSFSHAEEYHFASIESLFEQQVGQIVLPEIYSKLGIDITITPMPGKRAQRAALYGKTDGEIMRIWSYSEENPTMLRVPTAYYQLETMAFVHKDSNIVLKSKVDISKYNILKIRGVKHTNNITADLRNVFDYDNTQTMMQALRDNPSSIALTNTADGLYTIKKLNIDYVKALPPALATLDLYHYVNQKHAALVPRLDTVIKTMKQSGELDKLLRKAEAEVLASLETSK
ncbi:substrate-binding periplasmic protein [Shewanella sp. OMA3-2]|uniref:substrate-binding periplasmic protein n=1 Tax=Shewanella sp. OMA3-2 TaxID=2908650 RepID=UPI001F29E4E3|nr:transporter substrate-binding domain-containing protein [Shewanella sp. OMA3-2]UJF21211.1 transporter substrate-binding domain-containing protein [Shewanella sp. OMA3-2]